jgi:glycerol-3-phosphate acyltransferase PlsY
VEDLSIRRTLNRGFFHIFAGSIPPVALLFLPRFWVIIGLIISTVVLLLFEVARLRIPPLNRWFSAWLAPLLRKEEQTRFTGGSYLMIGYLITTLVFAPDIALVSMLFASLGDPVATMIGAWRGNTRLLHKSVEGTMACLLVCLSTSFVIFTTIGKPPLSVVVVGAVIATLVELLPLKLNDNLTVSIGSAAVMTLLIMIL